MSFELFENFNTTNQTSPHNEKHLNFAKPLAKELCERISLLEPSVRCEYVSSSESCQDRVFLLNYNRYFYCMCDDNALSRSMCIIILLVESTLIFWMIHEVTNHFLIPALTAVSKWLKMNEYVAGVTVMTLGNNAPDIFGGILALNSVSRHNYSDTMAKNLFVSTVISSIVMWSTPFAIDGTFFLRDVGFVLLYVSYVDFTIKICKGFVTYVWAVSMALVCPIYIIVILIDVYLQYRKDKQWRRGSRSTEEVHHFDTLTSPFDSIQTQTTIDSRYADESPNKFLFRQFFSVFDTLDRNSFNSKWTVCKLWALVKVPLLFCLRFMIPQMNFNDVSYSWSKLLCCIQITTTPNLIILMCLDGYVDLYIWTVPTVALSMVCFVPISILAFRLSRTDAVPKWYPYMSIITFIVCAFVLYATTAEVIALMETMGIVLHCSHTFIGCTVFTWGYGWAELNTNVGMARKGFPRMAFSACFGVIILSIFTSICIPILYAVVASGTDYVHISEGTVGETTSIILIISLIMFVLYGITTNFMLRRSGGLMGITMYVLYLILSISSEFEFIHAFGTDHSLDRSHFDEYFVATLN